MIRSTLLSAIVAASLMGTSFPAVAEADTKVYALDGHFEDKESGNFVTFKDGKKTASFTYFNCGFWGKLKRKRSYYVFTITGIEGRCHSFEKRKVRPKRAKMRIYTTSGTNSQRALEIKVTSRNKTLRQCLAGKYTLK